MLDGVRVDPLEESRAPCGPAAPDGHVAGGGVEEPEPEGVAHGGQGGARILMSAVRLLEGAGGRITVAGQVGGRAEGRAVLVVQGAQIDGGQALVGRGPRALLVGPPAVHQLLHHVHGNHSLVWRVRALVGSRRGPGDPRSRRDCDRHGGQAACSTRGTAVR